VFVLSETFLCPLNSLGFLTTNNHQTPLFTGGRQGQAEAAAAPAQI
jgi:hypothetical protein